MGLHGVECHDLSFRLGSSENQTNTEGRKASRETTLTPAQQHLSDAVLGKSHNLLEPPRPHLWKGNDNNIWLPGSRDRLEGPIK